MKNHKNPEFRPLAKKIARVEVVIIVLLIAVWLSTYGLIAKQKQKFVDKIIVLQEEILSLAGQRIKPGDDPAGFEWPFHNGFNYLIIENFIISASSIDTPKGKNLTINDAFGQYINGGQMLKGLRTKTKGSDWIRRDKISPKQWISWSAGTNGSYITAVVSDENAIFALSGFNSFKFLLIICACLCSALLLLALIWILSWLRISAVKTLLHDTQKNPS